MWWKAVFIVLSLGLDNLITSVGLGASQKGNRIKISVIFALFEALMPAIGFALGRQLGEWIGTWTFIAGLILLAGVGIYILVSDDDDDDEQTAKKLTGFAIWATAVSISIDELAVGFSLGLLSFPIWLTLLVLGVQAFCFTYIGLTFGARLKPYLDEKLEKLSGIVLLVLAAWLAAERWLL